MVRLPAPAYIDYVFSWVQSLLDDENTFPTKNGSSHPFLSPSSSGSAADAQVGIVPQVVSTPPTLP